MCNSRLWLNVETGDVSTNARPGYQNGCGCRLNAKTRLVNAHCPANNGNMNKDRAIFNQNEKLAMTINGLESGGMHFNVNENKQMI